MVSLSTARVGVLAGMVVYVSLLQWAYAAQIQPQWGYMAFEEPRVPWVWIVAFSLVAVAPALIMPMALRRPSDTATWLLYVMAYVPSILVPPLALGGNYERWTGLAGVLLACMLALGVFLHRRPPQSHARRWTVHLFDVWLGVLAILLYALLVLAFGFSFRLPELDGVYSVRADYKLAIASAGSWSAYAVAWTGNVLNPVFMLYGGMHRRWHYIAIGVLGQLFLFGITGLKSLLLSTVLIALLWLATMRGGNRLGLSMAWGAVALVMLGAAESALAGSDTIFGIIVRRTMVIPGQLTGMYVDYFSTHPKAYLGHSILSSFVDTPYDDSPPKVIAATYFAQVSHANANLWADGFANFGYPGIFAATAALAAMLAVVDRSAIDLDPRFAGALLGLPAFNLSNSGLLTCILTHGIGLLIAVQFVMPRPNEEDREPRST